MFNIVIPSYKRSYLLRDKTLELLKDIPIKNIKILIALPLILPSLQPHHLCFTQEPL